MKNFLRGIIVGLSMAMVIVVFIAAIAVMIISESFIGALVGLIIFVLGSGAFAVIATLLLKVEE